MHVAGDVVHTGQLFFNDADDPERRRLDLRDGGSKSLVRIARQGKGYVGTITMGVQAG